MVVRLYRFAMLLLLAQMGCRAIGSAAPQNEPVYTAFGNPQRVTIEGYDGDAMEPFITRDGRYLFFNNSNALTVNTNLHFAERVNDLTFKYKGEIAGVNTSALEGVPTMDQSGNFYFVSNRSYDKTLSTIYHGRFADGALNDVDVVAGISQKIPGHVNFDVEVSADGTTLYFVDGVFSGKPMPDKADIAIAVRDSSGFHRLENSSAILKAINTDALEYAACISSDQLELFFTRATRNGPAIYRAARKSITEPFDLPARVNTIQGFVEAPTLSPDGRSLYYHKKDGDRFTIYRVVRGQ